MTRTAVTLIVAILGLGLTAACGGGEKLAPVYFQSDRDGQWEIYSVSWDGLETIRLTNDPGADRNPAVLFNNQELAWISDRDGQSDVWVGAITKEGTLTNLRNVTDGQAGDEISYVSWVAGGQRLIFSMSRPDVAEGRSQVYAVNYDGTGIGRITTDDSLTYLTPMANQGDASRIAVAAGPSEDKLDIHVINIRDGSLRNVLPDPDFTIGEGGSVAWKWEESIEMNPHWNPLGRAVLFVTNGPGKWELWSVESDGRSAQSISAGETADYFFPTWSEEQKRAYMAMYSEKDGNPEIYRWEFGTTTATRLTNNPAQDINPSWDIQEPVRIPINR